MSLCIVCGACSRLRLSNERICDANFYNDLIYCLNNNKKRERERAKKIHVFLAWCISWKKNVCCWRRRCVQTTATIFFFLSGALLFTSRRCYSVCNLVENIFSRWPYSQPLHILWNCVCVMCVCVCGSWATLRRFLSFFWLTLALFVLLCFSHKAKTAAFGELRKI